MGSMFKIAGFATAACAACCTVSLFPALLAGAGVLAVGGAAATWSLWAVAFTIPALAFVYFLRRRLSLGAALPVTLAASSCACGPSCGPAKRDEKPIACTLEAGDFRERAEHIRDLARRSLRHSSRAPLSLSLTYELDVLEEVRNLIAKEADCCSFLSFDLRHIAKGVFLIITAPSSASGSADALFDHFAPDLAACRRKAHA